MINFSFSKEQLTLREEIITFAKTHLNENVPTRDKEQVFDRALWRKCGALKLPGLCIPKAYGGKGLGALSTVLALEALGFGCEDAGLNFAIAAHLLACVVPICLHGTEEQKQQYLPSLSNGESIAANAITESIAGSDAFNMEAIAKRSDEGFKLSGHKTYVSNGPVADVFITYVMTDSTKGFFGGVSAFILDKKNHILEIIGPIDKLSLRTCLLGELKFNELIVKQKSMLGKAGAGGMIFNQSMDWERVCLGAIHLGSMDRLLNKAIEFANNRKSGGQSISKYQAVSHPLAELKSKIEAARLLTYKTAWKLEQGKKIGADGAITKLRVSETYQALAIQLKQLYAGGAIRNDHFIERAIRDAMASTIYSGTSEVMRNIIARQMGLK